MRLAAPFQLPACPDVPVSDVVIISQTCDVVQKTRKCILIAPIAQASEDDYREAARGKRPLLLAFPAQDDALVVLLEHATSVPKTLLADALLVRRMSCEPASRTARDFARRVGAAYSRFPMPDEAIPALSKFTDRIRKEAPKDSSVGRVLKRVREIRVESRNGWSGPTYELRLFLIVGLVAEDMLEGLREDHVVQDGGDGPELKLREACDRVESAGDEVSRAEAWHQVAQRDVVPTTAEGRGDHVIRQCGMCACRRAGREAMSATSHHRRAGVPWCCSTDFRQPLQKLRETNLQSMS